MGYKWKNKYKSCKEFYTNRFSYWFNIVKEGAVMSELQASRRRMWFYEISKHNAVKYTRKKDKTDECRKDNCSDSRAKRENCSA